MSASTAETITAVATVFASIGTIGAVWVSLWLARSGQRRRMKVRVLHTVLRRPAGVSDHYAAVMVTATNQAARPITIEAVTLFTLAGVPFVVAPSMAFERRALNDSDAVSVAWERAKLWSPTEIPGDDAAYVVVATTTGETVKEPIPGYRWARRTPWAPRRKRIIPEPPKRGE